MAAFCVTAHMCPSLDTRGCIRRTLLFRRASLGRGNAQPEVAVFAEENAEIASLRGETRRGHISVSARGLHNHLDAPEGTRGRDFQRFPESQERDDEAGCFKVDSGTQSPHFDMRCYRSPPPNFSTQVQTLQSREERKVVILIGFMPGSSCVNWSTSFMGNSSARPMTKQARNARNAPFSLHSRCRPRGDATHCWPLL